MEKNFQNTTSQLSQMWFNTIWSKIQDVGRKQTSQIQPVCRAIEMHILLCICKLIENDQKQHQ